MDILWLNVLRGIEVHYAAVIIGGDSLESNDVNGSLQESEMARLKAKTCKSDVRGIDTHTREPFISYSPLIIIIKLCQIQETLSNTTD